MDWSRRRLLLDPSFGHGGGFGPGPVQHNVEFEWEMEFPVADLHGARPFSIEGVPDRTARFTHVRMNIPRPALIVVESIRLVGEEVLKKSVDAYDFHFGAAPGLYFPTVTPMHRIVVTCRPVAGPMPPLVRLLRQGRELLFVPTDKIVMHWSGVASVERP